MSDKTCGNCKHAQIPKSEHVPNTSAGKCSAPVPMVARLTWIIATDIATECKVWTPKE